MIILIADDEPLVRIGIRSLLESAEEGFSVVEAASGEEAMRKIIEMQPELAFLDINMPPPNGLEIAERITQSGLNTYCVMLTCYEDKEYMRQALRAGASDYLFKTDADRDELLSIAKSVAVGSRAAVRAPKGIDSYADDLYAALTGSGSPGDAFETWLDGAGADCGSASDILVISPQRMLPLETAPPKENVLISTLKEICDGYGAARVAGAAPGIYVAAGQFSHKDENYRVLLSELALRLITAMGNYFNKEVWVGISAGSSEPVRDRLRNAAIAAEQSFYVRSPSIIYAGSHADSLPRELNKKILQDFRTAVRTLEYETMRAEAACLEHHLLETQPSSTERVIETYIQMFAALSGSNASAAEKTPKISSLLKYRNLPALSEALVSAIDRICPPIENTKGSTQRTIAFVTNYIEQHIGEEISLPKMSALAGVSPSYFSKMFKDTSGEGLISYVTGKKIERAKFYINSGYKLYMAAESVGYENYNYFSRLFKKHTGMTPEEYASQAKAAREGRSAETDKGGPS